MNLHSRNVHALILAAALGSAIAVGAARANDISFVSTIGNNANACTLKKPCRTLQRAINVTAEGGEVRILDSGSFGKNATIRKSLTISGGGNTVLLGKPDRFAIVIEAPDAVVALRGLRLNGRRTAGSGIGINEPATVHIEDCVVHGFTANGIVFTRSDTEAFITDSTVRDNGNFGLLVGGAARARISNSTFTGNGTGIFSSSTVESRGNNTIRGNGTNIAGGTLTPFPGL